MKKLMILCFAIAAFAFTADKKEAKLEKALLWKIEKKNHQTSYLFGTIHLMPKSEFSMPQNVSSSLEKCGSLMLEVDISAANANAEMLKYAEMPEGITMQKLLSESDFAILDSAVRAASGIPLMALNNYKPFVIESFLLQSLIEDEQASFEMELIKLANSHQKEILELETIEEQMKMFDDVPYEEQVVDLMRYARGDDEMKNLFADLVKIYQAKDLEAMDKMMLDYFPDEKWLDFLLYNRNEKWITKIDAATKKQSVFIAVGAGHLPGDAGLINLLKQNGYSVSPAK